MRLSGWGNFPVSRCRTMGLGDLKARSGQKLIPRGMGRSYGDSALAPAVVSTLEKNRFIDFNSDTGVVIAEAGVLLKEVIQVFVPKGWFPGVSPGTKYVTLGGMVACDVHGKNHHAQGSFGNFLLELDLQLSSGKTITCNPRQHADVFNATIGGMGLTGIIKTVTFRLQRIETCQITQDVIPAKNLTDLMEAFEASGSSTYSVAWIDCLARGEALGRGVLFLGEHTKESELSPVDQKHALNYSEKKPLALPFFFPNFFLNFFTLKIFNKIYYLTNLMKARRRKTGIEEFFYPLDHIADWNKMYGRQGFVQYQFCVPKEKSKEVLTNVLSRIAANKSGSFLAVLKLLGKGRGWMSFPQSGYTLALDFPATEKNLRLLTELDEIVHLNGGRVYLAKDARLAPQYLELGYPDLARFLKVKKAIDPNNIFCSDQWTRLRHE